MWLHNQKPKPWLDDDPLAESSQPAKVLDPQRDWDIMDDSNISTINGIVRDWSNNFASSGAVTRINGVNMVSSQFRNTCTEELNWFKSITKKRIGFNGKSNSQYIRTAEDKERILPELTERVMRAYNQLLGIPIDQTVFDLYIARHNNSSNPADRYDAIISAISMSRKGSLLYFLDSFSKSVGASVKIAGKSDV